MIQDLKVKVETITTTTTKLTNGGKPGNGKPRKEVRNYRCKYHQQNTRDRRDNLMCRKEEIDTTVNSGHNEKIKSKDNWNRGEQRFPAQMT